LPLPLAWYVPAGRSAASAPRPPHADLIDLYAALAEAAAGLAAAADAVYAAELRGGNPAPAVAAARAAIGHAVAALDEFA